MIMITLYGKKERNAAEVLLCRALDGAKSVERGIKNGKAHGYKAFRVVDGLTTSTREFIVPVEWRGYVNNKH